jgi:hypothetical protein
MKAKKKEKVFEKEGKRKLIGELTEAQIKDHLKKIRERERKNHLKDKQKPKLLENENMI